MSKTKTLTRSQVTLRIPTESLAMLDRHVQEATAKGYPVERAALAVAYLQAGMVARDGEMETARMDLVNELIEAASELAVPMIGGSNELADRVYDLAERVRGRG